MPRVPLYLTSVLCLSIGIGAHAAGKPQLSFVNAPLSFEPNVGQSNSQAAFISRGPGYSVQLMPGKARIEFATKGGADRHATVGLELFHANADTRVEGEGDLPGMANYFPGPDKSQWRSNIPTFARVHESNVYPGVDLTFYGHQNRLEYDFILSPHADEKQILLDFTGADHLSVDSAENLVLAAGGSEMRFLKPEVYQLAKDGVTREKVEGGYNVHPGSNRVGFSIGAYDHSRPLVIDPVLESSQYLQNYADAITVDAGGNIYLVTGGYGGNLELEKINPAGATIYSVMFGRGFTAYGVAVDTAGRAYIGGIAQGNPSLPTGSNSYNSTPPQNTGAFFIQLSADGSSVPYATYLSGVNDSSITNAYGMAIDSAGNAYLAGSTNSLTFPTTPGVYQSSYTPYTTAGFVAKFNPSLSGNASLVYSTFITGSSSSTTLYGLAVDSNGNAYVTGSAQAGFPVTNGAFQYNGYESASGGVYVTKLNPTATNLNYSAYLGYGTANAIAVDKQGCAYATGLVGFADFPTTAGAYQTSYAGGFVTKLNQAGSAEVYSTFLGGPSSETWGDYGPYSGIQPYSIALTPNCPSTSPVISCNAYVSGMAHTADFPMVNAIQTTASADNNSGFVVELSSTGQSALFSTYLTGANYGLGGTNYYSFYRNPSLIVDSAGNIDLAGNLAYTFDSPPDFPVTILSGQEGGGFLAQITPKTAGEILAMPSVVAFGNQPVGVSTGTFGSPIAIRVANLGTAPAVVSSVNISSPAFAETNNCGTIAAGSYCNLSLNFTPGSAGTANGVITVTSNSQNSPLAIPISGTGYDQAVIKASASALSFGNQILGASPKSQALTLTNIGDQPAAISFSLSSQNFSQSNNCGTQLAPHSSCNVTITSQPTEAGLQVSDFYIDPGELDVTLSGSAVIAGVKPTISIWPSKLTFDPIVAGSSSTFGAINLLNTSPEPIAIQSVTASGDFVATSLCNNGQLNPEQACVIDVVFAPTASGVRSGSLTIVDNASGSPHVVALSGSGLASTEKVDIYPSSSVSFPNQPLNDVSGSQNITLFNMGTSSIFVDRVLTTGDFRVTGDNCTAISVTGTADDGSGILFGCAVSVSFTPTALGLRTGTLTFVDSDPGSPHVVQLSGSGITATGSLQLSPSSIAFGSQPVGSTSSYQYLYLENPGDSPINLTSFTFPPDYSLAFYSTCGPTSILPPNGSCTIAVEFSPSVTGSRNGIFTVQSSAGSHSASLTGTGTASTKFVELTPGNSMSFGSQIVGQAGPQQTVYVQNTGTSPVNLSSYSITGANAADFVIAENYCFATLAPGSFCSIVFQFAPGASGNRSATLTLEDSATGGQQTLSFTGVGVVTAPLVIATIDYVTFPQQTQGTSATAIPVGLTNNTYESVTMGNVTAAAGFVIVHGSDNCSGATLPAEFSCYVNVQYAPPTTKPSANAPNSGPLTFKNSTGTTLLTVPMAGYSLAPTFSSYVTPVTFSDANPVTIGTTNSIQDINVVNTGNTSIAVGAIVSSNPMFGFQFDYCSNQTLLAGEVCDFRVKFSPSSVGQATTVMNVPITYSNGSSASLTSTITVTAATGVPGANLSSNGISFVDQTQNSTSPLNSAFLTNSGTEPLTVGTLTGVNTIVGAATTGEFSTKTPYGTGDGCSGYMVAPGQNCEVQISFTPVATGARTGSITFPITYANGTTSSMKLNLNGNGVAPFTTLEIYPSNIQFGTVVQGTARNEYYLDVTNVGNAPITISKAGVSTNPTEFQTLIDTCSSTVLAPATPCFLDVEFTPAANSLGVRQGVLTITGSDSNSPHTVSLYGNAISATRQVVLSQSTLNFGDQTADTVSATQTVYVTFETTDFAVSSVALGGANAADFQTTNDCIDPPGNYCTIGVTFAPQANATGTRTATVTLTASDPGSPHIINLTGTALKP